jgi:Putative beta-barrel porin 2
MAAYPIELVGLLAPPAQRGPFTLLPSISVSEEYNDNVHGDNRNREWDFITNISPAISLSVNRPSYQLNAGYTFSAAIYARGTLPNEAFQSQNFIGSGSWQMTRTLTLSLSDSFVYNKANSNTVAVQGFSVGQQESLSNTLTPGMSWQMNPANTLNLGATYGLLRFLGGGNGQDSDTYGINVGLTHAITQRLSGNIGYGFTYIHFLGGCTVVRNQCINEPDSTTHTPTIGFGYQLTPTLSTNINGGAAVTQRSGHTDVSPAGSASLIQMLSFGSARLDYNQGVSVAGGFGGSNNTLSVSGLLTINTLLRNLLVVGGPTYSRSDPLFSQAGQSDIWSVSLDLRAIYRITPLFSAFGSYSFFLQRSSGPSNADVDQNRVRFGLQVGYPFNFD